MKSIMNLGIILALFFSTMTAFAQEKTFTGTVSDSMCTTNHMLKEMKAANQAECVRKCVKDSFDYALVVGKDYYILKGNPQELDKYAAQRVTVKGTLQGDTLTATSITPAPAAKPAATKKKAAKK